MTTIYSLLETANTKASDLLSRFFAAASNPLVRGDLLAHAKAEYPPERYPTAWKPIPEDMRRPLTWDGKLLNGKDVAELGKGDVTDEMVKRAIRKSGKRAAILALAMPFLVPLLSLLPIFPHSAPAGALALFSGSGGTPYPMWAEKAGAWLPVMSWYVLATIEKLFQFGGVVVSYGVPLLALFFVFWFFGFTRAMSSLWDSLSYPLRVATRDAILFHKTNQSLRDLQIEAYDRAIDMANGHLKDQPFLPLGKAAGLLRDRADMEAPTQGQIIGIDGESIRQHVLIGGDTGVGKTRLGLRPLFRRIINAFWGEGHKIGAYITDGKGTLWKDLLPMVEHRDDVAVIGTDGNQFGVDLTKGMSPLEISSTFKAVSGQMAGAVADDFWPESASLLLMHAATMARALEFDRETVAEWVNDKACTPYSLLGIALLASDEGEADKAIGRLKENAPHLNDVLSEDDKQSYLDAYDSAAWFQGTFFELAKDTRSSIIANVNVVLGKLRGARSIARRFCSGTFTRTVDVDHALTGGILFNAVGETEHGLAGKVVTVWLKSRLYVLARRRLLADPEACKRVSCAMFVDEFQMLATSGPDSDSTTWNWSREAGLFLVAATQSLAAIKQVMGEEATLNLVNLLRTKIILKTGEVSTVEYCRTMAGEAYRGFEYENLYATHSARLRALGECGPADMSLGILGGLLPKGFKASTNQYPAYGGEDIWNVAKKIKGEASATLGLQHQTRLEDRNRQAAVEGVTKQPKLDFDEFQLGSGFAFVIAQRAGIDRMDIVDLRIDD